MGTDMARVRSRLMAQTIGTPSWGYADSGTRFHVWRRPWSPRNLEEKLQDAAQVQKYTGICPYIDLHTAWDAADDWKAVRTYAESLGLKIGAVNPHLFADNDYVLGTVCNPDERIRRKSLAKLLEGIEICEAVGSKVLSLWFADGTSFPGQDSFRVRKQRLEHALAQVYAALPDGVKMIVEYKLFEPAFYSMDIADWGTAYALTTKLGPKAQVLVDMGHHALGANIEQIVAILLSEKKLGGFHFNDHKYADDDLTVGAINPYQLFLVFCELVSAEMEPALADSVHDVVMMIDENQCIKPQIEGCIQSVLALQTAYAKALMVDYHALAKAQAAGQVIQAEECLKDAYNTDVRPLLEDVRTALGRDPHPLEAFRKSGYMEKITRERGGR